MFTEKYMKELALFAGGILFGTAGVKVLSSRDAKKVYVHTTAAALRAKDCVMDVVGKVQENAEDVLAEARSVNEASEAACCDEDCACQDADGSEAE